MKNDKTFYTVEAGHTGDLLEIIRVNPERKITDAAGEQKCLGIALDIGTTSVVAVLYDLKTGQQLAKASGLNPQTQYGGDVITRITYAKQTVGLDNLHSAIIEGINQLINQLTEQSGTLCQDIYFMIVAANTTMLHLFIKENPASLAVAPFEAVFLAALEISAPEMGLNMNEKAAVHLTPSASSFVGGDILAGLLAIDFASYRGAALFIDIGTNGELAAIRNGKIVATSTAAGPAFEGMNITFGCRAEDGAIEGVRIDDRGNLNLGIIGQRPKAKGLCGSGLIELTAELIRRGVILPNGRFASPGQLEPTLAVRLTQWQEQKCFLVDEDSGVVLTQKDIRQIQLAKGALLAGITMLSRELDIKWSL